MDLAGKVVLVLGATSTTGNELVLSFLHKGATVIALGKDKTKLEKLSDKVQKDGFEIVLLHLDITKHAMLPVMANSIFERFGKLDYVVNLLAHSSESIPLLHINDDLIIKSVNTNVTSQILLLKYITPLIEKSEHPVFIHFSCKWTQKMAYNLLFNAGKAAIESAINDWKKEIVNPNFQLEIYTPEAFASKTRRKIYPDENHDNLAKPIDIIEKLFKILDNKQLENIEG
ncbi:MAG: SDR family NAD(P)-dependent oxidoreductase [Alphaproteobacteria bacterium]|nr:SDR family NAD(P)-dependent oxidoreductase [Alphaproteobacteria bacterium]